MSLLFLGLTAFFVSLVLYFFSFKYPSLLVFTSILTNVLTLLIFVYKFGLIDLIKDTKVI